MRAGARRYRDGGPGTGSPAVADPERLARPVRWDAARAAPARFGPPYGLAAIPPAFTPGAPGGAGLPASPPLPDNRPERQRPYLWRSPMSAPRRSPAILGVLIVLTAGCSAGGSTPSRPASPARPTSPANGRPPAAACASAVTRDALPGWARTGFHGDGSGVPHVFGEHREIVAVLFNYPPVASADPDEGNKILWVSRLPQRPMRPLTIKAELAGTTTAVTREVAAGPGPSMINLPRAGCWRLALAWSGHTDAMTLAFG